MVFKYCGGMEAGRRCGLTEVGEDVGNTFGIRENGGEGERSSSGGEDHWERFAYIGPRDENYP
jgi:hypothetical protein